MAPPSPCSIICFPTAREHRKLPSRTIATTARQPLGERSSAFTTKFPAALFTRTSTRPKRSTAAATSASTCSGSRTSVGCARPAPPAASMSPTVSSRGSGRRPARTTPAPKRPNSSAKALPRPLPPPVTSATFPSKVPSASMGVILPADDPRIERNRTGWSDEEGVDLELDPVGPGCRELRKRGRGARCRLQVDRRAPAGTVQPGCSAERLQQAESLGGVHRSQRDGDVVEEFGKHAAEADDDHRSEAKVAQGSDDHLHSV